MAQMRSIMQRFETQKVIRNVAKILSGETEGKKEQQSEAKLAENEQSDKHESAAKIENKDNVIWLLVDTETNEERARIKGIGTTHVFGRTHRSNSLDLGITSSKVSRRQIVGRIEEDGIECEVTGTNSIRLIKKDRPENPLGHRVKNGSFFIWREGDIVDFCWQTQGTARLILKRLQEDNIEDKKIVLETSNTNKSESERNKSNIASPPTPAERKTLSSTSSDAFQVAQKDSESTVRDKTDENQTEQQQEPPKSPNNSPKQRLWQNSHQNAAMGYRRWPSSGSISPRLLMESAKSSPRILADSDISPISGRFAASHENENSPCVITSDKCPFPSLDDDEQEKLDEAESSVDETIHNEDKSSRKNTNNIVQIAVTSPTITNSKESIAKGSAKIEMKPRITDADAALTPSESGPRIGDEYQASLPMLMAKPVVNNDPGAVTEKGSISAWSEARHLVPIPEDEAGNISEDETKEWTEEDHITFDKAMREWTKDFGTIARKGNFQNGKIGTKELIQYYYRKYKNSDRYKKWKQYILHETRSAAMENEFKMGLRERRTTRSATQSDREDRESNSSTPPSRGQQSNTLKDLVDRGVIKPGKGVLSLSYHGKKFIADLGADGQIKYKNTSFDSVSSWSVTIKRTINPKLRGDNGWNSVQYNGKSLAYYRDRIDTVGVKNTISTSAGGGRSRSNLYTEHQACIDGLLQSGKIKYGSRVLRYTPPKSGTGKVWHASLCENGDIIMDHSSKQRFKSIVEWLTYRGLFKASNALNPHQQKKVWNVVSMRLSRSGYKPLKQWRAVWNREKRKQQKLEKTGAGDLSNIDELKNADYTFYAEEPFEQDKHFCKCRKREIENDAKAWYIQCSKGTSICNGWIHPACFDLEMTRKEGDKLSEFICPLCSADGQEYEDEEETRLSTARKRKGRKAYEYDMEPQDDGSQSRKRSRKEARPTTYAPGTLIRSVVEWPKGRPIGWFLARILEVDFECHPRAPYKIAYGFDTSCQEWCSLCPNEPTRMLASDWNKSKCYKIQDIRWRSLAIQTDQLMESEYLNTG